MAIKNHTVPATRPAGPISIAEPSFGGYVVSQLDPKTLTSTATLASFTAADELAEWIALYFGVTTGGQARTLGA
jgi:hypothetical protein